MQAVSIILHRKMTENVIITEVLKNPSSVRPLHDKVRRENEVRPTPPIPNSITHHKSKVERCTRHFCISQYNKVEWLAGCETANKVYCWPCLLLSSKHEGLPGFK